MQSNAKFFPDDRGIPKLLAATKRAHHLGHIAQCTFKSHCFSFFSPQTALKSYGKSATFRQHYYPEGGWGWVVAACCFAANAFTFGLQLSFGVMQAELLRHLKEHQVIEIISKNKKNIFLKNYFEGNDAGPVPPPASQRCDGRGGGGGSVGGRGVIIGRHNCGGGEPSGGEAESR